MAALLLATGCTAGPPAPAPTATGPVPAPTASVPIAGPALAACQALLQALPAAIDPGVERRPVEGDPAGFAAWGDPPVLLQCGVAVPDRQEQPATVNGVAWSVRDIGAGFRWTTTELGVNISVDIPDGYANGAELINPLAAPILATLPQAPSPAPGG